MLIENLTNPIRINKKLIFWFAHGTRMVLGWYSDGTRADGTADGTRRLRGWYVDGMRIDGDGTKIAPDGTRIPKKTNLL